MFDVIDMPARARLMPPQYQPGAFALFLQAVGFTCGMVVFLIGPSVLAWLGLTASALIFAGWVVRYIWGRK